MKKQITTIVATVSLFAILTAIGIAAGLSQTITANIPFDFTVSGKTLPAGNYTVTKGASQGVLILRNFEKGEAVGVIARSAGNDANGKANLTFRRYGNQHFLAGVLDGINASEIPTSKAERKAARGNNNLAIAPEVVTIRATAGQ
ncbi:MAG: hypothetical protein ACKVZH_01090 [Blastocatellia bacterium]